MTSDPTKGATDPARQDALWADCVSGWRRGVTPPFAEQWARYQEIYAGRAEESGPPLAWRPTAEQVSGSNLGRFMAELGFAGYEELYRWSIEERGEFWARVLRRLDIQLVVPPESIRGAPNDVKRPRWLSGAALNCADSCFSSSPGKVAVIAGREGSNELETTSYAELRQLAGRVANGLLEQGVMQNDSIALYMPMTVECVAAYLGIVRAGCRVISIADSFSASELRRRTEIGGAGWVLTVDSFARAGSRIPLYAKVREAGVPRAIVIPAFEESVGLREGDLLWGEFLSDESSFRSLACDPYDVTNVLFSSGTTADPKAIAWTHLTPIKCAMDGHFHHNIQPDDVVAWPTNIGWMMGPWLIYATLVNGATMALFEGAPHTGEFARFVQQAGVTVLGTVPSLVRAWRSAGVVSEAGWNGVRLFSSTGEPSNSEDYLWLMSLTGYRAPVIEYCGGTEIGGGYITGTVVQPASPATFTSAALGSEIILLDDAGQPVAEAEMGEVYLVPPSIGLSETLLNKDHDAVYYDDCPRGPADEILRRHGDQMVRLANGFFKARGRADDTMNLGGIKVSSLELETVLDADPAVYESAAIAVQPQGEGAEKLVVFVVPREEVELAQLKKELNARIARELNPLFKLHDLVIADSLPRTASNKLMRRTLREQYMRRPEEPA